MSQGFIIINGERVMTKSLLNNEVKTRSRRRIPSLRDSALIVIDMQCFFCDPESHAYIKDTDRIIKKIHALIESYRAEGLPVIYTRHALLRDEPTGAMGRWWRDTVYDDEERSMIDERLKPLPQDIVIRKTRYSAFYNTNLKEVLHSLNVKKVVITGVLTHLCCESTARDAFMRDFDVFFVVDATASDDEKLHNASLLTLSDGFATLIRTDEVLECIKKTWK